jgi:hypothetical protein
VAMIMRTPGSSGTQGLELWQSFEPSGGVCVSPARDFIAQFESVSGKTVCARRLMATRTPAMQEVLQSFVSKVNGRPFPTVTHFVLHWLEGQDNIDSGTDDFFCAQLVAATYMQLGLLPRTRPANAYSPESFSGLNKSLPLQLDARLEPEISVTSE